MKGVVDRYVELLGLQLVERASGGGELSQDREGEYVEQFDALWRTMTPEDQEAVERYIGSQPEAPEDLGIIDVEVAGGHVPRRAA